MVWLQFVSRKHRIHLRVGVPARIGLVSPIDIVIQPGSYCSWDPMLFPQKGDRPHSNEASGSDLYGDLYFVIGEETLILPSKQSLPPIQYDSVEAKALTRPVNSMERSTKEQFSRLFVRLLGWTKVNNFLMRLQ